MLKDSDNYKLKLNIKSIIAYESMTGKPFSNLAEDEEVISLIYCMLISNNDINMTFEAFIQMMSDKSVQNWIFRESQTIFDMIRQFDNEKSEPSNSETNEAKEDVKYMKDIISALVINNGVDINYLMLDMSIWELNPLLKAAEEKVKSDLTWDRLMTYLNILPHVDGKKIGGPDKLLPFTWEKEDENKDTKKRLDDVSPSLKNVLGRKMFGEDGEG